ncbi:MAG: cobalt transporter [Rhodobiaceae bacterium]|nr:cobalt transporter [Rhodobiaceae bacterium]MBH21444.1 cobalt transporter [Rhodobiaceae bacterium]OUT75152.1 MAG: cobalt transporter [Rhizobiales bacterium TMED25]
MVIAIGLTIIMVFGLASPDFIHDAAHDVRHAMTFPCH